MFERDLMWQREEIPCKLKVLSEREAGCLRALASGLWPVLRAAGDLARQVGEDLHPEVEHEKLEFVVLSGIGLGFFEDDVEVELAIRKKKQSWYYDLPRIMV